MGDRGQNVVGLEAASSSIAMPIAASIRWMAGNCGRRSSRHLAALPLVFGEQHMAERRLGTIEGHEQIVGLLFFEQKQQIARKAKHRRHRFAARAGHLRNRVKHLKDQRIGVDDPDRLAGQRGRFGGRFCRSGSTPPQAQCGSLAPRRRRFCRRGPSFILHAGKHGLTSHERDYRERSRQVKRPTRKTRQDSVANPSVKPGGCQAGLGRDAANQGTTQHFNASGPTRPAPVCTTSSNQAPFLAQIPIRAQHAHEQQEKGPAYPTAFP